MQAAPANKVTKMPVLDIGRRHSVPVLYCRGTHYDVGFDVGRTFRGLIQDFIAKHGPLNEIFIPCYETDEGKQVYNKTLSSVNTNFPQYVREIQGTADGAQVPFWKLFLLHMDDIMPLSVGRKGGDSCAGCSTITCNEPGQELLGHNEDALAETLNHWYIVSAHIISDSPQGKWKKTEEKFTAVCYAGTLPGFCISYNHHGLAYSINIVSAKGLVAGKTPENMVELQKMLRDEGTGAADGVSVNLTFLLQDGSRLFHNAEVAPDGPTATSSNVNIITATKGETIVHTNRYVRLKPPEVPGMIIESSQHRESAIAKLPQPTNTQEIINVLGDKSDHEYPVYVETGPDDFVKTIMTGIFNCTEKTLSVYTDNPKNCSPLVVLPLNLKK